MTINDIYVRTIEDLETAVTKLGFLPFFGNSIPGFSLEEHVASGIWFTGEDGPWEWKGPVINELGCAYGKFFEKKAEYSTPEHFMGAAFTDKVYDRTPEESYERVFEHLHSILPGADENAIKRFM